MRLIQKRGPEPRELVELRSALVVMQRETMGTTFPARTSFGTLRQETKVTFAVIACAGFQNVVEFLRRF